MSKDDRNALEPLADSLTYSIGMISNLTVRASTNLLIFGLKGISDTIKLIKDVAKIGYEVATGTYGYVDNDYYMEGDGCYSNCNTFAFRGDRDNFEKKIESKIKPLQFEYLDLDESFMENNTLPTLANYKSNMKDRELTLKCYVGVEEGKKPHEIDFFKYGSLMIGGMSRWGKTSLILSLFTSLCERYDSDYLKIALVDFKRVDLIRVDNYKNVMNNCVTDMKRFYDMLIGLENECENRAELFRKLDVGNIVEYNNISNKKMKPIIVIIDEIGRIMDSSDDKDKLQKRLSSLISISMGFGIYFVIASQELSKDTLGKFKSNVGQSIGFHCQSKIESDQIIKDANLFEIEDVGRAKHQTSKGVVEFQSYFIEIKDIRELLKGKRK